MDGEIPLDADRLPAGVCIGCRQPKEPVRMLPELRAGKGPWCTACLGELVRRAVIAYPAGAPVLPGRRRQTPKDEGVEMKKRAILAGIIAALLAAAPVAAGHRWG
jgi:hypothetical protein